MNTHCNTFVSKTYFLAEVEMIPKAEFVNVEKISGEIIAAYDAFMILNTLFTARCKTYHTSYNCANISSNNSSLISNCVVISSIQMLFCNKEQNYEIIIR